MHDVTLHSYTDLCQGGQGVQQTAQKDCENGDASRQRYKLVSTPLRCGVTANQPGKVRNTFKSITDNRKTESKFKLANGKPSKINGKVRGANPNASDCALRGVPVATTLFKSHSTHSFHTITMQT
jgi:hypothetical protein